MLDLKPLCSPWFYPSKSLNLPCYQYLSPIFLLVLNLCFFIMSMFFTMFPMFSHVFHHVVVFSPVFSHVFFTILHPTQPPWPAPSPTAEAPGHGLSGAATRGMAEADAEAVQRLHGSGCAMECTEGSVCCGGKAKMGYRYGKVMEHW